MTHLKNRDFFSDEDILSILMSEKITAEIISPNGLIKINHLKSLDDADADCLTFYTGKDPLKIKHLNQCILICSHEIDDVPSNTTVIKVPEPKVAFYIIAQKLFTKSSMPGIHPTAIVDNEAEIHESVEVGPYCIIEKKCQIGAGSIIRSHAIIKENTYIGSNVIIEEGAMIGCTGVVFAWDENNSMWLLPQIGETCIGDGCFIGARVSIARGSLKRTSIGNDCKISQGSVLGHDSQIGAKTHLGSLVAVAGAVNIGKMCFVGSGASFRPGSLISNYSIVGVGAVVINQFMEEGSVLAGVPAKVKKMWVKQAKGIPVQHFTTQR